MSVSFSIQCAVIVVGVVGTVTNAIILYAMVVSKQHRKHVLIFNQNVLDLVSCFFLVVTYVAKLCNVDLTNTRGSWLCKTILSEGIVWGPLVGFTLNLIAARYLKVVHPVCSQKILRRWMVYTVSAYTWIAGIGFVAVVIPTATVVNGICYSHIFPESRESQITYLIFFLFCYIIIFLFFIFCYWRILAAVRHQARVMAGHGAAGASIAHAQSHQIQHSVIKTMILVCALYAVTQTPLTVYYVFVVTDPNITLLDNSYYALFFVSLFYISANPFIYATNFDPVKRVLLRLIPCNNTFTPPAVQNIQIVAVRTRER